jgi:hypothetical protein
MDAVRRWELGGRKHRNPADPVDNPNRYTAAEASFLAWEGGRGPGDCDSLERALATAGESWAPTRPSACCAEKVSAFHEVRLGVRLWHHDKDLSVSVSPHMATGKMTSMPQSLHASEVEDWLDHEIASLRQSVESQARARAVPKPQTVSAARRSLRPRMLQRLRRLVSSHRLEIVFLALSVTVPPAIVWVVFSMVQP